MTIDTTQLLLLTDLVAELPAAVRLQRLVGSLRAHFACGAVALLRLEQEHLRPLAVDGLASDALGRRFAVKDHPRLAAILARRGATRFPHDSALPDPYDGLVDGHPGQPLPVHDCMGMALDVEGERWGVVTLDALDIGRFDAQAQRDLEQLASAIEAAVRLTRLEVEVRALRTAGWPAPSGARAHPREDSDIVGQSEAIVHLLHELQVVADSELPALLLGETGVGKELFAHRLHQLSRRAGKPLVHVNCAALPESLAESELFGHAKGAFSGAMSERPGRFEAADGGTLFLDEVGELPLAIQAKLLRTLQNGEIQRLGTDRPRRVNVRVIAATNRQLRELVREGAFRADLYHRLSVYPIPIPPLRERGNDVLLLAGRFLELNRARLGLRSLRLSAEADAALRRYRWPGNVRELEHVISRAALKAVSRGADRRGIVTLEPDMLDLDEGDAPAQDRAVPGASAAPVPAPAPLHETVAATQRQAIQQALALHGGNWAAAARALDLDASNLHKLARRLGLKA
ncbi:MAG: nitric oxide reductase transcriptional regulator NorR [Comamonadaceae bacterium]|jgi:anaerobic nitric oxide reductase transcription regulator|uniref:Nitric oxide reductase transcriptional regulator NorR n=1 Tax=Hydrogenophaga borbori TaxID=2294117 RepID=A0A372EHM7_9BURK|nr:MULTISPECIES: nitric oxide reductase transcriptional regulator NorR [Hydrogenophaga]NCT97734.1 nitric oxide reductase transcriptional regulator NorR [Comamonadaceae bacterium]RFP77958.1 nitric oxide reductase transcriptional regulator NorR [Hydrogenophaga borbori]WQB83056.1 nitric oxide reductase transcriptional regulator NorR [Hydrogenophaga sp. SNF1]